MFRIDDALALAYKPRYTCPGPVRPTLATLDTSPPSDLRTFKQSLARPIDVFTHRITATVIARLGPLVMNKHHTDMITITTHITTTTTSSHT